ncbi:tetratricopeptide repeat protein [Phenylobacterium sp.]|uniref:tetratricopeptide repeat protein n=1 Tax=Phenylobacterium sp. TaxID=1871053 RepID=UPI0035B35BA9
MARYDRRGLPLSTSSDAAAARYAEGVDLLFSAWPDAGSALDAAIAADPDFALAHAARARAHASRNAPAEARASIAKAAELVAKTGDERERSHVETLSLALSGQSAKALEHALAHADRWPLDAQILSLPMGAFGLFAFSGMADHDQARVDLCARHAGHYGADDWWFLFTQGWSRAENGEAAAGRAQLERAFELRPANANTVHGLAHAMVEGGDFAGAGTLISGWLPGYDRSGVLHGHLAWHAALVALERGDADEALSIYAAQVRPSVSAGLPINVVTDSASLLWRLRLYGHEAPAELWAPVATFAKASFPRPGHAFVDAHMALIEAASGERTALERRIAALSGLVEAGGLGAGAVVPAICRAALAFAEEDYAGCAAILEPVAAEVARIGGSGAQREIMEDTLIAAWLRAGELGKARARLEARLERRPSSRDRRWLAQAA